MVSGTGTSSTGKAGLARSSCTHFSLNAAQAKVGAGRRSTSVFALACVVFLVGLLLSYVVSQVVAEQNDELTLSEFERYVDDSARNLETTLTSHFNLLVALQGLFHASAEVSRKEFRAFIESMDVKHRYPGVHSLSRNEYLLTANTAEFERRVREDRSISTAGYAEFAVHPETSYSDRIVVSFLEPVEGNEGVFGFDIGSDAVRREGVERARDSGKAVATAPITLLQKTGEESGFLYMLPVYGVPFTDSVEERIASFKGVVVAVYRIGGLLHNSGELAFDFMQVRDVGFAGSVGTAHVLYSEGVQDEARQHTLSKRFEVGGRVWEMVFARSLESLHERRATSNIYVGVLGALASLMSALLVLSLATSRQRAVRKAALLTQELSLTNKELVLSNENLNQFAHVASHDLQTPLRNMSMSVRFLEEELGKERAPEVLRYLRILKEAAERMRLLLEDLLLQACSSEENLSLVSVDLNETLESTKKLLAEDIEATSATIETQNLPLIDADEMHMERVFQNLISNAIKYRHKDRAPKICISAKQLEGWWELTVQDNGMGIEKQFYENIFEPFRRLHSQGEITGTGLGLGICSQIIERHGGTIGVQSSDDSGTTFLIRLPV